MNAEPAQPSPQPAQQGPQPAPTLTFRGGGWVIVLAVVLMMLVLAWGLLGPLLGRRPHGDGRNLESYQFDLSSLAIDRAALTPSGFPRAFLPSLDETEHLRGAEILVYNERNRPKYLVTTDRVAGIVINGQAHAWPLTLLNAHEVVNDTVAGVPVVATYSPLCDSFVVFDRRIGGVARKFEVSGLLVNSNLVFCDKSAEGVAPEQHTPSLFLQLQRRAIAGPAAKDASTASLTTLPGLCITTWADWLAAHPDTTVTLRDAPSIRRMVEISYAHYFLSPKLEFPASPLPAADAMERAGLRLKSPLILLRAGSRWKAIPIEPLLSKVGMDRSLTTQLDGIGYTLHLPAGPAVARIERSDGAAVETIPCLYFAAESVVGPLDGFDLVNP